MITEIVEIEIKEEAAHRFIEGVKASEPVFKKSPGFIGLELHRSIESPALFTLMIRWESVAHHVEMFQKSPEFVEWRGNVGDCFAATPRLHHTETQIRY